MSPVLWVVRLLGLICFAAFIIVAWGTFYAFIWLTTAHGAVGVVIAIALFAAGLILWSDWLEVRLVDFDDEEDADE